MFIFVTVSAFIDATNKILERYALLVRRFSRFISGFSFNDKKK